MDASTPYPQLVHTVSCARFVQLKSDYRYRSGLASHQTPRPSASSADDTSDELD